jgi:hypothetical protein
LRLAKDSAVVLVLAPAGGRVSDESSKRLVDGVAIDYRIDAKVTYTISAEEALNGPKPVDPNYIFAPGPHEASITVDAAKVRGRVNPLVFGACFEDLNHEIYGGLYAQMIYGESFEEGPEKQLPPGWRLHADWLKRPIWQGMWCTENDAIGMTGFRWYKLLWEGVRFEDGVIECELMQPAFDPGRPVGLVFRAGGHEFRDGYAVVLDAKAHRLELRIGERGVAGASLPTSLGQWLSLRVDVMGGKIRVFAQANDKPVIEFVDPKPLEAGLVGFDASESHGWFRKLKIETGGKSYTPPLTPDRPAGYRGPVSRRSCIEDFERGRAGDVPVPEPWQQCNSVNNEWFDDSRSPQHVTKRPEDIIRILVDTVARNGNLLLNIALRADGTVVKEDSAVLDALAEFMAVNSEAIHGTRPWIVSIDRPSDTYFTTKPGTLYAICLRWPDDGKLTIRVLAEDHSPWIGSVKGVSLLGTAARVRWTRTPQCGVFEIPGRKPERFHGLVLKLQGDANPGIAAPRRRQGALRRPLRERHDSFVDQGCPGDPRLHYPGTKTALTCLESQPIAARLVTDFLAL